MIFSFASSKGGVGKSTTCAAIAAKLAQDGKSVLVLDLDLNQTVARWAKKAAMPGLEAAGASRPTTSPRVPRQGVDASIMC